MTDTVNLRRALVEQIAAKGSLTDPAWRSAVEETPRETFLPHVFFRMAEGDRGTVYEPLRRDELGDEEWLRLVYTDETWVTQVDGHNAEDAAERLPGAPTSSSTLPSLVVRMLELACIQDGEKVLEVGTGTGYSTAILSHRLGDKNVTSIEYDPGVAKRAADRLATLGYHPTLVTGDGLKGYEPGAEYHRLVATCSVRYIPTAWLWQVRGGGTITTTLNGWMHGSGLVHLTVASDGTAEGRFSDEMISYMPARPHSSPPRPPFHLHQGEQRPSRIDPAVVGGWMGRFVAQLAAPSAELLGSGDDVILLDVATGSQACTRTDDEGGWVVHQWGPLRLWDAVESAITTWQQAGSPPQSVFGMTITPDDYEQTVWLGSPDGPSWHLPG